ncbi:MAG: efflux RND transporter periplasmic adaptor subunit [Verrucomicrobiota bacterium]|nr:efflux RND transporter periplasmic adaptor subunit [Verrucomicrobiota bacterium]
MNRKSLFGTIFLILIIMVLGVGVSWFLLSTGPETTPEEKSQSARIVQTIPVIGQTRHIAVSAYGSVVPSRKVVIRPQVSGQVIHQNSNMAVGGQFDEGDELIRIDPQDYVLALAAVRSDLEQARFEREVESGRQVIAQREWDELQSGLDIEEVNRSLVLREPHLRRAEAMMEKAINDIEEAELQLSRTVIRAPFNARVVEESVEVGQLVSPNSTICELVGTDEYWIQVSVPFSELKWIQFPQGNTPGAGVEVVLDAGEGEVATWEGRVVRLLSDLDDVGRMARVVVAVQDPLDLDGKVGDELPLLLGSYVEVRVDAGDLEDVITVPRDALREGDQIWVVGPDNLLRILQTEVLWTEKDTVIITNSFEKGDELIVSDLRVALPQMLVAPQRSSVFPELVEAYEKAVGN